MRALTPARLLLHPDRYPWFTSLCCRTFRLHPLNIAPVAAMLCYRPRLGPRFALAAIGGASDFVQSQQSQQSYSAVSSSDRESPLDSSVYGLSLHFQLLSTSPRGDAVTFTRIERFWRHFPVESSRNRAHPRSAQYRRARRKQILITLLGVINQGALIQALADAG